MKFEELFQKLLDFYKVKTTTELAERLNVTRSTVSGWKNRQATGAILEFLFKNHFKALEYILSNKKDCNNGIKINNTLMLSATTQASKYGLNINNYLEHLIIQDLEKNIQ